MWLTTSESDEPPKNSEGLSTEAEPLEVELWGELWNK